MCALRQRARIDGTDVAFREVGHPSAKGQFAVEQSHAAGKHRGVIRQDAVGAKSIDLRGDVGMRPSESSSNALRSADDE